MSKEQDHEQEGKRQGRRGGQAVALTEVRALRDLKPGNWIRVKETGDCLFRPSQR